MEGREGKGREGSREGGKGMGRVQGGKGRRAGCIDR